MPTGGVGSISCYHNFEQVGEGTYGYVFRAVDRRNNELVALKRLIFHKENLGFPLCAVREIKFLRSLHHKNIVKLLDIATSKGCEGYDGLIKPKTQKEEPAVAADPTAAGGGEEGKESKDVKEGKESKRDPQDSCLELQRCGNLYLVFEYVEHDLGGLIDAKYKFPTKAVKSIMLQLLEVLEFLIEKKIIHRDIKSSNILISDRHVIKLADFGLARSRTASDGREGKVDMTNNVITMWYKPPELLLGEQRYSHPVDMWSAGCVLAELELGRPIFPGKSESEQLDLICRVLGTPTEENWPGVTSMNYHDSLLKNMPKYTSTLRQAYSQKISEPVLGLLDRIFVADPTRRFVILCLVSHILIMEFHLTELYLISSSLSPPQGFPSRCHGQCALYQSPISPSRSCRIGASQSSSR